MFNIRFFLPAALFVCSIAPAKASDSEIDRASLKGLQGVFVLVEDLNPPEEQAGLKTSDIQADAEQQLKAAGIPLLSKAQNMDTPGMPTLYISVSVASSTTTDLWPFSIDVNLEQAGHVEAQPRHLCADGHNLARGLHRRGGQIQHSQRPRPRQ